MKQCILVSSLRRANISCGERAFLEQCHAWSYFVMKCRITRMIQGTHLRPIDFVILCAKWSRVSCKTESVVHWETLVSTYVIRVKNVASEDLWKNSKHGVISFYWYIWGVLILCHFLCEVKLCCVRNEACRLDAEVYGFFGEWPSLRRSRLRAVAEGFSEWELLERCVVCGWYRYQYQPRARKITASNFKVRHVRIITCSGTAAFLFLAYLPVAFKGMDNNSALVLSVSPDARGRTRKKHTTRMMSCQNRIKYHHFFNGVWPENYSCAVKATDWNRGVSLSPIASDGAPSGTRPTHPQAARIETRIAALRYSGTVSSWKRIISSNLLLVRSDLVRVYVVRAAAEVRTRIDECVGSRSFIEQNSMDAMSPLDVLMQGISMCRLQKRFVFISTNSWMYREQIPWNLFDF